MLLAVLAPGPRLLRGAWRWVGLAPIVAGVGLHWWAWRLFRRRGTTVRTDETARTVVTTGPYRFTRHPMYLGGVLILLGGSLAIGTVVPAVIVAAYGAVADRVFIPAEERAMAERFGETYHRYRSRVRRWL